MIEFLGRSSDGKTFTLSIDSQRHTYSNDKEGKRQAILDGLKTIETVAVDRDVYLPSNEALLVVATILYPGGIQQETQYQTVSQVTEKASAHLGYGAEVQLGPPHVPFTARGAYRKKYPPVDAGMVLAELKQASTSSYAPQQEVNGRTLWNQAAWTIYNKTWHTLSPEQQAQIQAQVEAIVRQAGWQVETMGQETTYFKPLPADMEGAKRRLVQYLNGYNGQPVPARAVMNQAQLGAYNRAYYDEALSPELAVVVSQVLQAAGYQAEPEEGEYRPRPVTIPLGAEAEITAALAALPPRTTNHGPALLLGDVLAAVAQLLPTHTLSEWQIQQLIQTGPVGTALRRSGFCQELSWCQPYQFMLSLGDDRAHQVILKEVRVQPDPNKTLALAKGLAVYAPAMTIDDVNDTLVYLEMVGPKQSVKANWAALVGGGKVHWFGRQRVQLDGMKEHRQVQSALPCGWSDAILIHKQASLKEMNPEQPFYLLDDGMQPVPPLFYPMLNKALALPLLTSWTEYLWSRGREKNLITLLNSGQGQGYVAWRVLPAPEEWQGCIQKGIAAGWLHF